LELETRPFRKVISVSESALAGSLTTGPRLIFSSDSEGTVYASNSEGRQIWKVSTDNRSAENSSPVYADGTVYFSGPRELVTIDAADGRVVHRQAFDASSAHLFGRRVVAYGSQRILPGNDELSILDKNGKELRSIRLEKPGSLMTPAVWQDNILIADQKGLFYIIDAASGSVESRIVTGGLQPVALSVTVRDNLAYFSGRKGDVVCINLDEAGVKWEKRLAEQGVQVFSDIVCSSSGAYVFAEGTVYALDLNSGEELFPPIGGITAPPGVIQNTLVVGSIDSRLLIIDPADGKVLKTFSLDSTVSTRPVELNGRIAAGTSDGTVILVDPEGIR